jgi:hypothetical protein
MAADLHLYQELFEGPCGTRMRGLATGYAELDRRIGGIRGIWGIASEPGKGKTTLAVSISRHVVEHLGVPAMYLSLEMEGASIRSTLAANILGVSRRQVESGDCRREDFERLREWSRLHGRRLGLFTRSNCPSVDEIDEWRGWPRRLGRQPRGMLVIDSFAKAARLWFPNERNVTTGEDRTLDRLQTMVDGLGLCVLCICRLSKEGAGSKRNLDVRGSGSQLYDFDVALGLRAEPRPLGGGEPARPVPIELTIHKSRAEQAGAKVKLLRVDEETRVVDR